MKEEHSYMAVMNDEVGVVYLLFPEARRIRIRIKLSFDYHDGGVGGWGSFELLGIAEQLLLMNLKFKIFFGNGSSSRTLFLPAIPFSTCLIDVNDARCDNCHDTTGVDYLVIYVYK